MKASYIRTMPRTFANFIAISILTAGISLSAFAAPTPQQGQPYNDQDPYQQGPPSQQQDPYQPGPPQQRNSQPYPDQPYPGPYGSGQPGSQPPYQSNHQGAAPNQPPAQPAPDALTLQAGSFISVHLNQTLSSDKNVAGDNYSATLDQPLVVDGFVVARQGQTVMGRVAVAKKAGYVSGQSQLGLQINELSLVDGQQLTVHTQLVQSSGGTSNGRDAAVIAATTVTGAAIGGIADGGAGAGIGAGAGAATGVIGVLSTRGRATIISPEAVLVFRVTAPATISTTSAKMAFQPFNPADYASDQGDQDAYDPNNPYPSEQEQSAGPTYPPPAPSPYPPPAYYPPYPYYYPPYYGYHPGPVIGIGIYGGYGPRYYGYYGYRGGYRGYYGGGYHRH